MDRRRTFVTLDGIRGIAALVVVTRHTMEPRIEALLPGGFLAVDMFFVLSGFVLAHAYEDRIQRGMNFLQFMTLRIIRLYPLYIAGVAICLLRWIILSFYGQTPVDNLRLLSSTALNLFFIPTWPDIGLNNSIFPLDQPAWSLFWELLVNILFVIIVPFLGNRILLLVLSCGIALVLFGTVKYDGLDAGAFHSSFDGGLYRVTYSFFAGVAAYRFWNRSPWIPKLPSYLSILSLLLIFWLRPADGGAAFYDGFVVIFLFPILVLIGTNESHGYLSKVYSILGTTSYAIYVLHEPILAFFRTILNHYHFKVQDIGIANALLLAILMIPVALLADRFYDTPVRRKLVQIFNKKRLSAS